jgi:hypothetical protein
MSKEIIPVEHIESKILTIRSQKVILDADLAAIYRVKTKALNQAVKRNIDRFPLDFVFQLSRVEFESGNRSQSVTGSQKHRDPRFLPYVFTEHGAIMAANVLINLMISILFSFRNPHSAFRNPHSLRAHFQPVGLTGRRVGPTGRRPHSVYPELSRGAIIFALCFLLHVFCY